MTRVSRTEKGVRAPPIRTDEWSTELHPYLSSLCTLLFLGGWLSILSYPQILPSKETLISCVVKCDFFLRASSARKGERLCVPLTLTLQGPQAPVSLCSFLEIDEPIKVCFVRERGVPMPIGLKMFNESVLNVGFLICTIFKAIMKIKYES
jgi:hypothetical protein